MRFNSCLFYIREDAKAKTKILKLSEAWSQS